MLKRAVFSDLSFSFLSFFLPSSHPAPLSLSLFGTLCLMNIFQCQYIVIFSTSQLIVLSHSGFFSYYFFVCVFEEFSFHSRLTEIFSLYFFFEFIYLFLAMQLGMQDLSSKTRDLTGALQWKHGASTTGLPADSSPFLFLNHETSVPERIFQNSRALALASCTTAWNTLLSDQFLSPAPLVLVAQGRPALVLSLPHSPAVCHEPRK